MNRYFLYFCNDCGKYYYKRPLSIGRRPYVFSGCLVCNNLLQQCYLSGESRMVQVYGYDNSFIFCDINEIQAIKKI